MRGLRVPDTALIGGADGRTLTAWLRSELSGSTPSVVAVSRSQLSVAALQRALLGLHAGYDGRNPDGWVAVAHYSSGLARLVDAQQLGELVR